MADGKITIDDIARALGISKTTVSRAISGKGRVGDDTRARVMNYIEEHNYKPNMMARALAQQKTYNIGVVWPDDYNAVDLPFFQRCMIGMSEVTSSYGYDIVVSLITGGDISGLKRIIDNHKVDGIILTRTLVNDRPARFLKESGIPFVAVGSTSDPDIVSVDNDNFSACKELTSILIAKGLKRLALIGGSMGHVISNTRYAGFMDAFKDAGISVDPSLIYLDVESMTKVRRILKDLLKKKIDGVICMDDNIAGEVISRCRDEHIRIPEDIRLASFYNSSILDNTMPSITSLNFNDRNLGAEAAKSLLELIDGNRVANKMLSNYEVVLKESTK
ncbi:LacI family DNA-binding transcriptional regulator [Butyrivibrio sp. FCS014]|uniref:LacI family DNA-binding transcriptional regulator n=1 Tax=Butyrivibrio sp. FCS014 TaxID=1408304 RepID=UPI000464D940|nr:LacI family DNA-binding transcriptional regulator [Butyrivibrio sp. FCS014]